MKLCSSKFHQQAVIIRIMSRKDGRGKRQTLDMVAGERKRGSPSARRMDGVKEIVSWVCHNDYSTIFISNNNNSTVTSSHLTIIIFIGMTRVLEKKACLIR